MPCTTCGSETYDTDVKFARFFVRFGEKNMRFTGLGTLDFMRFPRFTGLGVPDLIKKCVFRWSWLGKNMRFTGLGAGTCTCLT